MLRKIIRKAVDKAVVIVVVGVLGTTAIVSGLLPHQEHHPQRQSQDWLAHPGAPHLDHGEDSPFPDPPTKQVERGDSGGTGPTGPSGITEPSAAASSWEGNAPLLLITCALALLGWLGWAREHADQSGCPRALVSPRRLSSAS